MSGVMAGLLYVLMHSLPVYPPFWDIVITVVVFAAGVWSPGLGYFLAVAAAAYAFYDLSLYLAVLFLAVALLGQRIFIRNLGATLLVIISPWLSPFYISGLAPIMGGVWWGSVVGAVMGGASALWGQIAAGMAGLNPDWLAAFGASPGMPGVIERFSKANSMDTLLLLIEPLAPDPTTLLHHLLQILLWAVVGGLVGRLCAATWVQQRKPWRSILAGWIGLVSLLISQILLGLWLQKYTLPLLGMLWPTLAAWFLVVAVLAAILEILRDVLEHPLPPSRQPSRSDTRSTRAAEETGPAPLPVPSDLGSPKDDSDTDDLIMLEID